MRNINSNKQVVEALDEFVAGHHEAKKALAVLLTRSRLRTYQKYVKGMDDEFLVNPLKLLLIGASGTGKTHMVETLSKIACFPLVKIDATDLNPSGASGGIKSSKLKEMIMETAKETCLFFPAKFPYLQYAIEQTVVYIDEIDKLGTSFESSGNWNKHVQSNFLTMFDNKDEYAGVSYIFSGAFNDITKQKEAKVGGSLGFTPNTEELVKDMLDEQIIKGGIIPELLGRINMIVELEKFTKKEFVDIINQRLLPKKRRDMAAYGVFDLEMTQEQVEDLAQRSFKSGQGVRYSMRELDRMFLELEYNTHWNEPISNIIKTEDAE